MWLFCLKWLQECLTTKAALATGRMSMSTTSDISTRLSLISSNLTVLHPSETWILMLILWRLSFRNYHTSPNSSPGLSKKMKRKIKTNRNRAQAFQACLRPRVRTERKRKKELDMVQTIRIIKSGQLASGFSLEKMFLRKLWGWAISLQVSLIVKLH